MGAPRRANRGSNKNDVPSAAQRRALNTWLLGTFGDGITAPCSFCQRPLFFSEITRDRYPKPGRKGGRYVKGNIRPACMSCNAADGARQAAIERARVEARRIRRNALARERYARRAVRPVGATESPGVGECTQAAS